MTLRKPGARGRPPFRVVWLAVLLPALGLLLPRLASVALADDVAAAVRVHDRVAFTLKLPRAGLSPEGRARAASRALDAVFEGADIAETRVEETDDAAVVFAGKIPIVSLASDDAAEAGESLHVYAATVAARVDDALRAERTRRSIAGTVFSISLLVFSGLVAFLLFQRVGQLVEVTRSWVRKNPDRIPVLRLGTVEVVRPNAVRGAVAIALGAGHLLSQFAIAYGWLLVALSLFDATRGYTEKLTGFVLVPFSALLGRIGTALPLVVLSAIAAVAVGVLVRFVALFFESVARGDTTLSWLPSDLAAPTSVLARAVLVLGAIVLAAPLLTGSDDGAFSRVGMAALVAVGLAATPVFASAAAGIPVVFGRHLRPGQAIRIGPHEGTVARLSLLAVTLEAYDGTTVRVPHLLSLVQPLAVLGRSPASPPRRTVRVDLRLEPSTEPSRVRQVLFDALAAVDARGRVELLVLDGASAHYRVSASVPEGAVDLGAALAVALRAAAIPLGGGARPRGESEALPA